jgi:hypothetical protein
MIIHQLSMFSFDEILKFQPETQLMKIIAGTLAVN